MKKIYLIIITIILFTVNVFAQPSFAWAKQIGNSSAENSTSIITDGAGNVYTTGYFAGTVDFDPGPGTYTLASFSGLSNVFICKLNSSGTFVWAKNFGGSGNTQAFSIALDPSGNVYTTGSFQGTSDFDPSAGVFNLTATAGIDIFVSKLDNSGNFVWAKHFDASASASGRGLGITVDGSNNIYTTGYFANNGTRDFDPGAGVFNLTSFGGDDIFISKLDGAGNFVWAKQLGGTLNENANGIKVDASGNVYSIGYFNGTADFDPGAGGFNLTTSAGVVDAFVSKLDASGNFVFAKQFSSNSNCNANSIALDGSNNIYICGFFNGVTDFDPAAAVVNLTSLGISSDVFISKLDVAGNFIWVKQQGGVAADAYPYGITLDASNNVYITGGFSGGTVDFDPSAASFNLTPSGTSDDIHISKLNNSGNFIWTVQLGGTSSEYGTAITIDVSGNILTTGLFNGTGDYDPSASSFSLTSAGGTDAFIHKMAPCLIPAQPISITGLNVMCTGAGATNYSITSVAGATSYTWSLPSGWSGASATNTISATPGTTGVFTVTASNACGSSPQQTLNVTVNPLPTISATTNNTLICTGQSVTLTASGANSYTWNPGGTSTSISVSPTATSTYTINGTDVNGCMNSSVFTQSVSLCTDINQLAKLPAEINIYPNPFDTKLIVVSNATTKHLQIFNTLGSLIYSSIIENEKTEIDLSTQPNGIYFIKIGEVTKKLIKE